MHTPTCPVKMAGTLQRRCADCHCVVNRRYLRGLVFHGQARDRLAVSRYAHSLALRPTARAGAPNPRADHRIPARRATPAPWCSCRSPRPRRTWRRCRTARVLRGLFARKVRKAGDCFHCGSARRAQTLLIVACLADEASTFERLQAAGKLARSALDGEPQTLLVWQQGCAADAANATLERRASRRCKRPHFASRRSRASRNRATPAAHRSRVGEEAARPRSDARDAAGNNLARWLTALPPNTLDARGYRRFAAGTSRRLKLGFKFYGETRIEASRRRRVSRGIARQRHARCRHCPPHLSSTRLPRPAP